MCNYRWFRNCCIMPKISFLFQFSETFFFYLLLPPKRFITEYIIKSLLKKEFKIQKLKIWCNVNLEIRKLNELGLAYCFRWSKWRCPRTVVWRTEGLAFDWRRILSESAPWACPSHKADTTIISSNPFVPDKSQRIV